MVDAWERDRTAVILKSLILIIKMKKKMAGSNWQKLLVTKLSIQVTLTLA